MLFVFIGLIVLSIVCVFCYCKELMVIINNFSVVMVLSEEVLNCIILLGGEFWLFDCDFVGEDVVEFFEWFCVEFVIFGLVGVGEDGRFLEFY